MLVAEAGQRVAGLEETRIGDPRTVDQDAGLADAALTCLRAVAEVRVDARRAIGPRKITQARRRVARLIQTWVRDAGAIDWHSRLAGACLADFEAVAEIGVRTRRIIRLREVASASFGIAGQLNAGVCDHRAVDGCPRAASPIGAYFRAIAEIPICAGKCVVRGSAST